MIEIKTWKEYTPKEQSELLQHWWYYYGKMMITLAEWEQFNHLVEKDSSKVLAIAVASYIHGIGSQPLVMAMRENKVDELLASLPEIEEMEDEEFKRLYTQSENCLISMLVRTYNNPEPSLPMEPEVMVEQVTGIAKMKKL